MSGHGTGKVIILNEPPTGKIKPSTFRIETRPIPSADELKDGQVLIKVKAFSNEPVQRVWIDGAQDPQRGYLPPVEKGEAVRSILMGEVVASKSTKYGEGSVVTAMGDWWEYGVVEEGSVIGEAVQIKGQSEWLPLSLFGVTGMSAYAAAFGDCKLQQEHVVVVSGAAGAIGSVFVQIAKKVIGCKRVVGIAGGKAKCDWVKSLGADECIDYKNVDCAKHLAAAVPDYADVYFDNVGGPILDVMLGLVKKFGTIVVCGGIAGEISRRTAEITKLTDLIFNRITIRGFIVNDWRDLLQGAVPDYTKWLEEGKIDVSEGETIVESSFEDVPKVWEGLFTGQNRGKLITKLI